MMSTTIFYASGVPTLLSLAPKIIDLYGDLTIVSTQNECLQAIKDHKPQTIIISFMPEKISQSTTFTNMNLDQWMAFTDDAIFELFTLLHEIKLALNGQQCSFLLLGPSLALTGAKNQTALATLAEGQRGLMKSLARQWGPKIQLNWLAIWPELLFDNIDIDNLPKQPELGDYTPPFGTRPNVEQLAKALSGYTHLGQAITGQTIVMDGGEWMLP